MEKDINKYISINRNKSGKTKITHDLENEANIYKLLHSIGFRKTTLNNKKLYFQIVDNDLIPVSIHDMRTKFYQMLKNFEFDNVPEDVSYIDILNWNLTKQPIKQNGLFYHYLETELNEDEIHILKMKKDINYKHRYEIDSVLNKLEELQFEKSIDKTSAILTNGTLYYKCIGSNKFLIFSHYNAKSKKNDDGFDCWLANYKNDKQIGKSIPSELKNLRMSFKLDRDFELIEKYVV